MKDISVILRMDWLTENGAMINCGDKTVSLRNSIGGQIVFQGDKYTQLEIGLELNSLKEVKIEEIPVVNKFQDVFPEELPGKANVVADALSRKSTENQPTEWEIPKELRKELEDAQILFIQGDVKGSIATMRIMDEMYSDLKYEIIRKQADDLFIQEEIKRIGEGADVDKDQERRNSHGARKREEEGGKERRREEAEGGGPPVQDPANRAPEPDQPVRGRLDQARRTGPGAKPDSAMMPAEGRLRHFRFTPGPWSGLDRTCR
ncbi:hypothetical protein QYE76_052635 [Lolium multiflorum]|uniref:Uncharacterized protein n=1 Tax=Lolium multiflorum TaxID=4521 RepID=A0AAD8SVR5_LOLMU|nr:hypothetical protein QYE76_052635 [Lolium multiflorum]